jgi:hypothetical protein
VYLDMGDALCLCVLFACHAVEIIVGCHLNLLLCSVSDYAQACRALSALVYTDSRNQRKLGSCGLCEILGRVLAKHGADSAVVAEEVRTYTRTLMHAEP